MGTTHLSRILQNHTDTIDGTHDSWTIFTYGYSCHASISPNAQLRSCELRCRLRSTTVKCYFLYKLRPQMPEPPVIR